MTTDVTAQLFHLNCSSHACTRESDGVDGLCPTCRQMRKDAQTMAQMSEREFQREVIRLAQTLGWLAVHFRAAKTQHGWRTPVQGNGDGFPDTIFVRDRIIFAELKSAKGRVSESQREWIAALEVAGVETYVWRPQDLDEVMRVLIDRRREAA